MQLRRVPVALAHGWGGRRTPVPFLAASAQSAYAHGPDMAIPITLGGPGGIEWGDRFGAKSREYETDAPRIIRRAVRSTAQSRTSVSTRAFEALSGLASRRPRHTASPARPEGVDDLVKLQRASGSWDLDEALAQVLGRRLEDIRRAMPAATVPGDTTTRAWATALALAWLERHASAQQDEWRALAVKAHRWLGRDTTGIPLDGGSWEGAARAWLDATPPTA